MQNLKRRGLKTAAREVNLHSRLPSLDLINPSTSRLWRALAQGVDTLFQDSLGWTVFHGYCGDLTPALIRLTWRCLLTSQARLWKLTMVLETWPLLLLLIVDDAISREDRGNIILLFFLARECCLDLGFGRAMESVQTPGARNLAPPRLGNVLFLNFGNVLPRAVIFQTLLCIPLQPPSGSKFKSPYLNCTPVRNGPNCLVSSIRYGSC